MECVKGPGGNNIRLTALDRVESLSQMTEKIAHRGAPRVALENTIEAFRAAIEAGADAVELDVHVTRDGVPVVHHDPALGRSALPPEVRGGAISLLSAADIRSATLRGLDGTRAGIPTLEEVLEAIGRRVMTYVEIKGGPDDPIAELLVRLGLPCAVHSFAVDSVRRMARLAPSIPRGLLLDARPRNLAALMAETGARDVWPAWRLVESDLIELVHARGGRVIPWTVNSPLRAARLAGMGVDGICTDDIPLLWPSGDQPSPVA